MRFRVRLVCSPLVALMGCVPGLWAQQQYCVSGTIASATGSTFSVGDNVVVTAAIRPGTLSCMSTSDGSVASCNATVSLVVQIGAKRWTSVGLPANQSQPLFSVASVSSLNVSNIGFGGSLLLSPLPASYTPDNTLGVKFELDLYPGLLVVVNSPPVALPSPAAVQASGVVPFFTLNNAGWFASVSYTGQSCGVTFVDPVPQLLSGSQITKAATAANALAGQPYLADLTKGRAVSGVATDGVAQVVLRILATSVGDTFTVGISSNQCASLSVADCGLVFDPTNPPANIFGNVSAPKVMVTAVSTPDGPMAFAAYRAPVDFGLLDRIRKSHCSTQLSGKRQIPC